MVVHACNVSPQEAEAGGSQVPEQSKTLSQTNKKPFSQIKMFNLSMNYLQI
jgi:hypothetical protein